jgi:hypothetical protein
MKGARAVALLMVALVCVLLPAQAATETTVWEGARLRVTTEPPARVLRIDLYNTTGHWTFHRWIQPNSRTYKPLHDRVATNDDGSAATFNWDCRVVRAVRT